MGIRFISRKADIVITVKEMPFGKWIKFMQTLQTFDIERDARFCIKPEFGRFLNGSDPPLSCAS